MNVLKNISKFLSKNTSIFVIAIAVMTFFAPNIFKWVRGTNQTIILGIIMFGMGLTLTTDDFKILAERPIDIFLGVLAQYTLMPLLAYTVGTVLGLPVEIKVGLILVGCCPGGVSSNIMSFLFNRDVRLSLGITTASTFLSPILTPVLVLSLAGEQIEVNAAGMFISIIESVIIPIIVGFLLNYFLGNKKIFKDVQQVMPGVSVIGIAFIVGGVISLQGYNFFKYLVIIFIAVLLHNGLGYLLGYGVGMITNMSFSKKCTISIEVGMKNVGLATNLATAYFATTPQVAVICAVSCIWQSISRTLLAGLYTKLD